jgi:anion-transporting  ArsA/GET3 family ATPase
MDPSRSPESVFDALAARQLLIVSGKGGVGRTTVAALLGLALARRGRKVLVATVGLDDRLAWMLGQPALRETPVPAAPNLHIQRVVPQRCIREYGALILHNQRIADAVFDNAPMRRLLRTIPGLDDFAILGKVWHESVRAHTYDAIIFDGPATGHLRYTLGIPQAILRTLSVGPLPREARLMQDSLEDNTRVQAVLVGLPDRWPLSELGEMASALREELHVNIGAVVVNGLWPELPALADTPPTPPTPTSPASSRPPPSSPARPAASARASPPGSPRSPPAAPAPSTRASCARPCSPSRGASRASPARTTSSSCSPASSALT